MEELFDVDLLRDGYGGVVLREVCGTFLFGKVFSAWMCLFVMFGARLLTPAGTCGRSAGC